MRVQYMLTDDVISKNKTEIERFIYNCQLLNGATDLELTLVDINPYQTRKLFELLDWEVDWEDENSTDRWYTCYNKNYNFTITIMIDTDIFDIKLYARLDEGK